MSTLVRKSGLVGTNNRWAASAAFNLSDGSSVLVLYDTNSSSSFSTEYGDRTNVTKIYVYSSTDRVDWTLRTTLTPPITGKVTANVSSNDTIGIIVSGTDRTTRYVAVPASTWTATAWEAVHAAFTTSEKQDWISLSFTPTNIPVIIALRWNNTGSTRLRLISYVRPTTSWVATSVLTMQASVTAKLEGLAISSYVLPGGTATARNLVVASGDASATSDLGVRLYTMLLNESTGAVTSPTLRATYAAGNVPSNSTSLSSRNVMLFPSDDNEYTLGIQHHEGEKRFGATRGTWNGSSWVTTFSYQSALNNTRLIPYGMTMSYSSNRLLYIYSLSSGILSGWIAKFDEDTSGIIFSSSNRWFDNASKFDSISPLGGNGPHVEYPTHDLLFVHKISDTQQEFSHHWVKPSRAPTGVNPANNATVTSSTPALRADADLDIQHPQSLIKMRWEFATDNTFTTNHVIYNQENDKLTLVRNTHVTDAFVPFLDVLPDEMLLPQGIWYVRAAHVDEFEVVGQYSATNVFTISHPPLASNLSPSGRNVLTYSGVVTHSWLFTDPSHTDKQTAYRIIIERNADGSVIIDTGKVVSTAQTYDSTIDAADRDVLLRWRVKLWDQDDVEGDFTPDALFMTFNPPSTTIDSPTEGEILATAIPNITGTVTVSGDRRIEGLRVSFYSGGSRVYTSGKMPVYLATGEVFNYQPPSTILKNSSAYEIRVIVTDNYGINSDTVIRNVTTAWTAPLSAGGVTINTTPYNTEGQGWITVTWNDTTRDADFAAWILYRKVDLIDAGGNTIEAGEWTQLTEVTAISSSYSYNDYYAPSGYRVYYRVEQEVNRFGDILESSTTTPANVIPVSNSYWVVEHDNSDAFQLGNVISDEYEDPYEEEEYHVIGRGRHVEVGDRLGFTGTLVAQVRDTATTTARQRKIRLESLKKENRTLYLRTPFGDVYRVAVKSMQVSRIAGVGTSEFIDVTIPYSEVSDEEVSE